MNEDCEDDEEVTSGRVEVSADGGASWGTVCDDYWDENDAKYVQLYAFSSAICAIVQFK